MANEKNISFERAFTFFKKTFSKKLKKIFF